MESKAESYSANQDFGVISVQVSFLPVSNMVDGANSI